MKVEEIMTKEAKACRPHESLSEAVRVMWDIDCGIVPIVDEDDRVVGVITDRDICIACWSHGAKPADVRIEDAMSKDVQACRKGDTVAVAERKMEESKIRRLPVVDGDGRLEGILSLNDIAREADREKEREARKRSIRAQEVVDALAAICAPRSVARQVRRTA